VITAHFIIHGEEREARVVPEKWLHQAWANRDNVLLRDGNTYRIVDVQHTEAGHARVTVEAPTFARGS
jgi:hypothetical protein